jgi:nucleoside-diphosphate-sugar epimerase
MTLFDNSRAPITGSTELVGSETQPTKTPENRLDLVTGATGLIGSHLVRRLRSDGRRVRVFVRPHHDRVALEAGGVEVAVGDLADGRSVCRAAEGARHIYHCGGLVTDWGPWREFRRVNVDGTRNVVEAALAAGVQRLVHLSSAAIYGYPQREAIDEQQPLRSRGIPYIATKIAGEEIVREAITRRSLPAVILRPVMVFGPGCQNYVGDIVRHLRGGSMGLLDGGRHVAGLAYVENVADALVLASHSTAALGHAMNICDDSAVTWKEYIDVLADGLGLRRVNWSLPTRLAYPLAAFLESAARLLRLRRRPLLSRLAVLELGQSQRYDISLARRLLGYTPRVGFEEAMRRTLEWAKQNL